MYTWGILHIINAGFLAVIMVVHLRFTRKDYPVNLIFSLFLFSLAYISFQMFLFSTQWILDIPHFCRTGTFMLYLIYPLAFLYIRKLLYQEGLKWIDLIHFTPALLYLVDFAPYFLQSADVKRQQLLQDYAQQNVYITSVSWLFNRFFHFQFRTFLSVVYVALSIHIWVKVFLLQPSSAIKAENRRVMHWTLALCMLLLMGVIPSTIVYLFQIPIRIDTIQNGSLYFATMFCALFLFFRPDIIYGMRGILVTGEYSRAVEPAPLVAETVAEPLPEEPESIQKKVYLKEETVERLAIAIERHFLSDKTYLKNSFSISDLSQAVGCPTHQLSAYLNNHLGMNFNEYINHQRIAYLLGQLTENPEWRLFTLEALGQKVGFNNRYTFLNAFKKVTGETPSVYLKSGR
jgi:AraC-like DNA-binding protein